MQNCNYERNFLPLFCFFEWKLQSCSREGIARNVAKIKLLYGNIQMIDLAHFLFIYLR